MGRLTEIQFIHDKNGTPEYAVIPYKLFKELLSDKGAGMPEASVSIPLEVVGKIAVEGYSVIQAWREYFNITQAEVAAKMGISQAAYSQMESAKKNRRATMAKIAEAFDISIEKLRI